MELKAQISSVTEKGKEKSKAENEASDEGPMVTEADIQHIVSTWTGIPVEKVSSDESERLLKMESTLHSRVIGQDEAVVAIRYRELTFRFLGIRNCVSPVLIVMMRFSSQPSHPQSQSWAQEPQPPNCLFHFLWTHWSG